MLSSRSTSIRIQTYLQSSQLATAAIAGLIICLDFSIFYYDDALIDCEASLSMWNCLYEASINHNRSELVIVHCTLVWNWLILRCVCRDFIYWVINTATATVATTATEHRSLGVEGSRHTAIGKNSHCSTTTMIELYILFSIKIEMCVLCIHKHRSNLWTNINNKCLPLLRDNTPTQSQSYLLHAREWAWAWIYVIRFIYRLDII